ncbi:MAG: HAD family hydrolase [Desulfovibrionales bacterium]|nr:HAD family hydrolase [Desulfovibrionales bacterium]
MRCKAVVFDMDGTLLDTLEDLAEAMNRVLERQGLPTHPVEAYRRFVGSGAGQLVARALPAGAQEGSIMRRSLEAFLSEYRANWKTKTRLYEGISDLLDALCSRNLALAVLTNKPQAFAELCVNEFLSRWPFALTLGQQPGVPVKPDPAAPRQLLRHLGVLPEEVLYLGDTDVDMFTAVNAGMYPIGVLWGFRAEEELCKAGAREIIAHPMELMRMLG